MGQFSSAFGGVVIIPDRFGEWSGGSAQDLAETANKVLAETGVPDAELNERLVRHYVTIGVLDPPSRKGREAIFRFPHLVQLMVIRKLLAERLTLSQVRDVFRTMGWNKEDDFAQLLSKPAPPIGVGRQAAKPRAEASVLRHLLQSKQQPWVSKRATGRDGEQLVRWKLNSWCEVLADPLAVNNLTDNQVTQVADEFIAALTHFRNQCRQGETEMYGNQLALIPVRGGAHTGGVRTSYAHLREQYRPDKVEVLFVAESPPESAEDELRFFYNPNEERRDYLYRSVMEAVFPEFKHRAGEKDNWLRRFQKDGYYLIDATDRPINRLSATERRRELDRAVEETVAQIMTLVARSTPIVLVKENIFSAFNRPLRDAGYNVIHESFLPFPSHGHQKRFVEACRRYLREARRGRQGAAPTTV